MHHDACMLPYIKAFYQEYVYEIMQDTTIVKAALEEPGLLGASLLVK